MVLFFVGAAALYWGEMKNKNRSVDLILSKMKELQNKKQAAEEQREELLARLNSQNDPAWVEMLLMRKLGVVPEGQVKVYFKSE